MADRGYFKIEDIEACEKAGIVPYVPRPQRGAGEIRQGTEGQFFTGLAGIEARRRSLVTQRPRIQRLPSRCDFSHGLLNFAQQFDVVMSLQISGPNNPW
jgi:hypothetical protein